MTPVFKRRAAIAALAVALAAPAEGIRQVAYFDPPGILTVCRGHTGPDVIPGKRYSLAECDALMDQDMHVAVNDVERCLPGLPEHVTAAMADAVYNLGPKIACDPKSSTPARKLLAADIEGGCKATLLYNKARIAGVLFELPGLTKRRHRAMLLCLSGEMPTDAQVEDSVAKAKAGLL